MLALGYITIGLLVAYIPWGDVPQAAKSQFLDHAGEYRARPLQQPYVHPELRPYVEMFKKEAEHYGILDKAYAVDLIGLQSNLRHPITGDQLNGLCTYYNGGKIVLIRAEVVKSPSLWYIVYHELTHCMFNVTEHSYGIMAPAHSSSAWMPYSEPVEDLFKRVIIPRTQEWDYGE